MCLCLCVHVTVSACVWAHACVWMQVCVCEGACVEVREQLARIGSPHHVNS